MKLFILALAFFELTACAHATAQGRIGGTRVRRTSQSNTQVWVDGQPKVRIDQSGTSTTETLGGGIGIRGSGSGIDLRLK